MNRNKSTFYYASPDSTFVEEERHLVSAVGHSGKIPDLQPPVAQWKPFGLPPKAEKGEAGKVEGESGGEGDGEEGGTKAGKVEVIKKDRARKKGEDGVPLMENGQPWTLEAALKIMDGARDEAAASRVEANRLKEEAEKARKEREEAEKKEAEKKGEFEKLYGEASTQVEDLTAKLTTSSEQLEKAKKILEGSWQAQAASIPEVFRELVQGMDLFDRLEWLAKNSDKLETTVSQGSPDRGSGNGTDKRKKIEQSKRVAARFKW